MERLTQKGTGREEKYILGEQEIAQKPYGYTGGAVDRLGVFEDVYEDLIAAQEHLSAQLEELRLQGKTKSYQFRELMGKKLVNSNILSLFRTYGIQ